jgi:hypothetical protein
MSESFEDTDFTLEPIEDLLFNELLARYDFDGKLPRLSVLTEDHCGEPTNTESPQIGIMTKGLRKSDSQTGTKNTLE